MKAQRWFVSVDSAGRASLRKPTARDLIPTDLSFAHTPGIEFEGSLHEVADSVVDQRARLIPPRPGRVLHVEKRG